ncbi:MULTISPECIES: S53 family peptidase [unclassified Kitasatospora]|uniref:S53 family peptidase n=1 Tax=unclassified Kitasatospora TaxID=2633591 RepID=UPI002472EE22|nr:S53 family peptidase [Kitasatospora sp. MAP12-44]
MRRRPTTTAALATAILLAMAGTAQAEDAPSAPRAVLDGSQPAYATADHDLGAVPAAQTLTARLYLGTRDPAGLAAFLRDTTDPKSHDYGHFLTPAQYQQRFGLTAAQRRDVVGWLTKAGLKITADTTHYLQVTGPAAAMNTALGTSIHRYSTAWGPAQAPARNASTPAALAGDVVALDGLSAPTGASPTAHRSTTPATNADAHCSAYFGQQPATGQPPAYGQPVPYTTCPYTPTQLRRAYGAAPKGATGQGRTVAVVDAYGSPTMAADANRFAAATGDHPFRPGQYSEHVDPKAWQISSACAPPASWAGEQALDVEMAHAYAPDANVLYAGADSCLDGDLMDAEASIIDTHAADLISNSWAEIIHAQPGHLTPGLVAAWDMLFQQAAAEGIGVYFAAGDCGDASPAAADTGVNCDPQTTQAQAEFPSGDPWVTSVGATSLATDKAGNYAWETSMGDALSIRPNGTGDWAPVPGVFAFGGGGGPSDFPQPWYQKGHVPDHLAGGHRVAPDVALAGDGAMPVLIGYTVDGAFQLVGYGGTSAATPGFAAIQADAEQEQGRAFGFANPLLYSMAGTGVFHDVTDQPKAAGSRPLTVVQDEGAAAGDLRYLLYTLGHDHGLPATPGYDAATGLGSPSADYLRRFATRG